MQEYAALSVSMVDICQSPEEADITLLAEELCCPGADTLVAIRNGQLFSNKLQQAAEPALTGMLVAPASSSPYRLEITKRGILDSLTLKAIPHCVPKGTLLPLY